MSAELSHMFRARSAGVRLALALAASMGAWGCGGDDGAGEGPDTSMLPNLGGTQIEPPSGMGVANYDRPPGMPIGRGGGGESGESAGPAGGAAPDLAEQDPADIEIPTFEMPEPDPPPCSGCVELNMHVDDINQRDDFVFNAGGVAVTRVVWTLIIPFNSDQLFIQPFVDSAYGTYMDLDANAFAIDTPVQVVHPFSGNANNVGIAIGSSGAWTGDMTMSVFVDAVTLEGADSASRTFDTDLQGLATRSSAHNPAVVFHP